MYLRVILISILSNFMCFALTIPSGKFRKSHKSEFIETKHINDEHLANEPSHNGNNNTGAREIHHRENLTKGNTNTSAYQSETSEYSDTNTTNVFPHALRAEFNARAEESNAAELETVHNDENLPDLSEFDVIEGDILIQIPKRRLPKTVVFSDNSLWPDKILYYNFVNSEFTIFERNLVENAIQDLRVHTCVKFVPRTTQDTYVRFRNIGLGCAAAVGFTPTGTAIDLFLGGAACFERGKIQHEILHSLGFWHEHTRPDRDYYIRVLFENIGKGHEFNMEKRPLGTVRTFGMPYDYGSLMHYTGRAFSKDGVSRTIIPLYPGGEQIIGQRDAMSKIDLAKVNRLYKCPEQYYKGFDIHGSYSISGPIPPLSYLPTNIGWFYKIGHLKTENEKNLINKFFNNTIHFSPPKPGNDNSKLKTIQLNKTHITYMTHGDV